MSISIYQVNKSHYLLNGKSIQKNQKNKCIYPIGITPEEIKIFKKHLNTIKKTK